jgi:hypothetical protein
MAPVSILDRLSPHARVATAIMPFIAAIVLRFVLGKGALARWLITISTMWILVNVLLAPFSAGMREDLLKLTAWFY